MENVQESASYCHIGDVEIIMPNDNGRNFFFGSDYSDNEDSDDFDSISKIICKYKQSLCIAVFF